MAFPIYQPQNLSLPPVRQLPEDVRNPLGSLAEAVSAIAEAQRKRKMDEQNLRTQELQRRATEMKLAEDQRQLAAEGDITKTMTGAFAPQPMTADMPAMTPDDEDAYDLGRYESAIEKLNALGTPEARKVAMDMETKVAMKKQDRMLKTGMLNVQKEKLKQNLLLGFMRNPAGLKLVQPALLAEAGLDVEAVANLPDEEGEIQYFDDPVMGRRPYVRTKQGGVHWLDAYAAQSGLIDRRAQRQIEQGRMFGKGMQYLPDQAKLLDKGAGTAAPIPVVNPPSPSGALPATLPSGKITGVQPTAPMSDAPPGPPPPLSAAAQESAAMGDIVQPPDASGTQPLYNEQEYLQPKQKGGSDPQKAVDRLRGEFMKLPPVQDVLKAIGGAKTMLDGFAANNGYDPETGAAPAGGAFDENLLAAWQKGLDPQSAVREGEISRTRSFLAAYPALSAAFDRWTRNEGFGMALDPASRKVLYAALQYGYGAKAKYISKAAKQYGKMAKNRNLPVEDLFVGLPDEMLDGVMDEINAPETPGGMSVGSVPEGLPAGARPAGDADRPGPGELKIRKDGKIYIIPKGK